MSQNDKELLEMAAKAAHFEYECVSHTGYPRDDQHQIRAESGQLINWNPLTDDGDALRLAVKLEIEVRNFNGSSHAGKEGKFWCTENWFPDGDRYAATRRAIVRAAAEIGKAMA